MVTTTNSDGTKTVDYDELDFGTATPFKSTTAYTISKGGSAVGTGIFIAANGTTGVLAAVVARAMGKSASRARISRVQPGH